MNNSYTTLATFEYASEAHVVKSKLDAEGITSMLMDEKTIDADPLISLAIGGVKLLILNTDLDRALQIYNEIKTYQVDALGNALSCPQCQSHKIEMAPLERKNIFYMLFPFFEKTRYICNLCKTIFE